MKRRFGELKLGEKFYLLIPGETVDLRYPRIKVSNLLLNGPPPWEGVASTANVTRKRELNCVILQSNDRTDGYFDYVPEDVLVYPEGPRC